MAQPQSTLPHIARPDDAVTLTVESPQFAVPDVGPGGPRLSSPPQEYVYKRDPATGHITQVMRPAATFIQRPIVAPPKPKEYGESHVIAIFLRNLEHYDKLKRQGRDTREKLAYIRHWYKKLMAHPALSMESKAQVAAMMSDYADVVDEQTSEDLASIAEAEQIYERLDANPDDKALRSESKQRLRELLTAQQRYFPRRQTGSGRRTRVPEVLMSVLKTIDDPHDIDAVGFMPGERADMEEGLQQFTQKDFDAVVRADEIEDILRTQRNLKREFPEQWAALVRERNQLLGGGPPAYDPKKHKTRRPRGGVSRRRRLALRRRVLSILRRVGGVSKLWRVGGVSKLWQGFAPQ